jgi:hypothetical protein
MHTWPLLNASSASLAFWLFLSSPEHSFKFESEDHAEGITPHLRAKKRGAKEENTRKKATTEEQ